MQTYNSGMKALAAALVIAFSAPAVSTSAHAGVITAGFSEGQALQLDVGILGIPLLNLGLPNLASGTFPGAYNETNTLLTVVENNSILGGLLSPLGLGGLATINLGAQVISASASGNSSMVTGSSFIDGLGLAVGANVLGLTQLGVGLGLGQLSSTSTVAATMTGLTTTSVSNVTGLNLGLFLTLLGLNVGSLDLTINLDSTTLGKNFDVLADLGLGAVGSLLGVSLIFNESIESCANPMTTCSVETNALTLRIAGGLLGPILPLSLKLGHSMAEATFGMVPPPPPPPPAGVSEPGMLFLMGAGLLGLGFATRRRKQA